LARVLDAVALAHPKMPAPSVAPTPSPARAERAQLVRFEQRANDAKYASRAVVRTTRDEGAHPLVWLAVDVHDDPTRVELFAAADAPDSVVGRESARLRAALLRTVDTERGQRAMALVPVHWEEAVTLAARFPELKFLDDGEVVRGASPRSLFLASGTPQQPRVVPALENYSVKTHLSAETYARFGGLGGSRAINRNDALFAAVIDHVFHDDVVARVPGLEVQREARAIVARVGQGDDALEVGAIFRTLFAPDETPDPRRLPVPGFALYSKTRERLPHIPQPARPPRLRAQENEAERVLALDAIAFACAKNPGLSSTEALLELFVDPLLDTVFALANRGWAMELHPQNFMLRFDPATGKTSAVVVRDLHGLVYSKAWREARGLADAFDPAQLQSAFPGIAQADVDAYFQRDGVVRERHVPPKMFSRSIDFFATIFWFHLLDQATDPALGGPFSRSDLSVLQQAIRDRVDAKATEHRFDMSDFRQPRALPGNDIDAARAAPHGVRGRILFRNRCA
jgi:hypothetical protein